MAQQYLGRPIPNLTAYRPEMSGTGGAVSSNDPYATRAGLEILRQGGNAVDAAVAVSLTLGVVDPQNSGIGGGCFTLLYTAADGQFHACDARGVAPAGAWEEMFLDENGKPDPLYSEHSARAVATPEIYRAYEKLLSRFGTMTLEQVSRPAIRLAREGFRCPFVYARATETAGADEAAARYPGFAELYWNNGRPRRFGEPVRNPDLADTMEQVARHGAEWFYSGPIGQEIEQASRQSLGVLTREDLIRGAVRFREPVRGTYRGYEIVSMPPPSSGGVHLIQMLNMLENFDLASMGQGSAAATHLIAETMKMMFADRSVAMGDPAFVRVQTEKLLSKQYAGELARRIDPERAQDYAPTPGIEAAADPGCTTNFTVQDRWGNMLAQTQTIRSWWGCGVPVRGRGFILNNNMADFSARPGALTAQGLRYGAANAIRPGKTPLSSMAPSILLKDGVPFVTVGSAGGPRIITSLLNVMLNVMEHGMMMDAAVRAPHCCVLTLGQGLELESEFSPDTVALLRAKGHKIVQVPRYGIVKGFTNGIMRLDGTFYPAGTWRSGGGGGVLTGDGQMCLDGFTFE